MASTLQQDLRSVEGPQERLVRVGSIFESMLHGVQTFGSGVLINRDLPLHDLRLHDFRCYGLRHHDLGLHDLLRHDRGKT